MSISDELNDQPLVGYKKAEDLIGDNGFLMQLTYCLDERALEVEMTVHPGHPITPAWPMPLATLATVKAK